MAKSTNLGFMKAISKPNLFVFGTIFGLSIAIISAITFSFISSLTSPVSAENGTASDSTDVTLSLLDSISIRTLDSARTTEIESLDMELTPTPSGRFIKDTTVVDVSTSNPSGYMLYMSSEYTDPRTSSPSTPVYTTDMINHDTNINDTVANLTNTNVSEAAFSAANTITSGTNSNPNINHWGYSLTENNVAGTYNPIPAYNASQTIRNDVVSAVEHSYTPVTVGVNVDTNIASGTYTNNLVFSTIVNPPYVDYSLLFNANTDGAGGDDGSVSNLPTDITERVMATSYTVTIPSTAPTRSNYVFSGYNTKADGTGTTYQPGDTYTLVVDDRQSAQTETAEETLYAIWNQYTYTVTYNCNSGSNCPANYSNTTTVTSDSYTIPTTEPTRTNYGFTGYLGSDNNTYQPGDTINLTEENNSITLTAQWEETNFWTITYMQDMTPAICNSVKTPSNAIGTNANAVVLDTDNVGTVAGAGNTYTVHNMAEYNNLVSSDNQPYVAQRTLYDIRDNNSYTVRKMADGNCWMGSSLNLKGPITLTSADTDITGSAISLPAPNNITYTGAGMAIDNFNQYVCHSSRKLCAYSWYVMTAGAGTVTLSETDVLDSSICPKGWRMPSHFEGQFQTLASAYGVTGYNNNNNPSVIGSEGTYPFDYVYGIYWIDGGGWYQDRVQLGTTTATTPDSRWPSQYFRYYILMGMNNTLHTYNTCKAQGSQIRCLAR